MMKGAEYNVRDIQRGLRVVNNRINFQEKLNPSDLKQIEIFSNVITRYGFRAFKEAYKELQAGQWGAFAKFDLSEKNKI